MRTRVCRPAAALLALSVLSWAPPQPAARGATVDPVAGTILAPVGRQVGWLSLEAPRPSVVTSLAAPAYVSDLSVPSLGPDGSPPTNLRGLSAALAVQEPLGGGGELGGDILRLDLATGRLGSLATRASGDESLGAPVWRADGSAVLFQREDVRGTAIAYPGQSAVRYPSRVELVQADGSGRAVLVGDARQPAPSPDGRQVAYVRSSAVGSALVLRSLDATDERELVPAMRFPDLAYPRFSPRGDQIAFMAAAPLVGRQAWPPLLASFGLVGSTAAYAHGLPWDLWMVGLDGAPPRLMAQLGGDDASPVWSPDGSQMFVYSGTGSAIVDTSTGEVASYPYLAGYGATAWVPLTEP